MEQDFYKNNTCNTLFEFENISYIFKVIDVFKNKKEEIFNNINTSEIVPDILSELPQVNTNKDLYFSTDHHGDLVAFLFSLLNSGVANYKENENSIIYFNTKNKEIIKGSIMDYKENMRSIIPIPNLEINKEFNGKFICGGDLIDRGNQSDICICLMYYLLNQDPGAEKIEYVIGNHEGMVIDDNMYALKDYDAPLFRKVGDYSFIKEMLLDLIEKEKLKFCVSFGNTIFSHTIFERIYLKKALEIIDCGKTFTSNKYYFLDYTEKQYFSEESKILAKNLKSKIYRKKEKLNEEDISILSKLINDLFKKKCLNNNKVLIKKFGIDISFDGIFLDNSLQDGLLWSREFSISIPGQINGLSQVVGHTPVKDFEDDKLALPLLENNIIFADVVQSIGYNIELNNSDATLLQFRDNKCFVKQKRIFAKDIKKIFNNTKEECLSTHKTNNTSNKEITIDRLIKFFNKNKYDFEKIEKLYILNPNFINDYKKEYNTNIFGDYCIYDSVNYDYYKYLENKIDALNYLVNNKFINVNNAKEIYHYTIISSKRIGSIGTTLYKFADIILSRLDEDFIISDVFNNICDAYDIDINRDMYFTIFNNYITSKKIDMCKKAMLQGNGKQLK